MPNHQTRTRVLALWQEFASAPYEASPNEMQAFYFWLLAEHPSLVDWPAPAGHDRREDVDGWIRELQEAATAIQRAGNAAP